MNDLVVRPRRYQIAVVFLGMVTGYLIPMAQRSGSLIVVTAPLAWVITPILYMAFAKAVEDAVGVRPERSIRSLAAWMFPPVISFVVEIMVLFRLAKLTATVTDEPEKAQRVLWLAVARPLWSMVAFPFAMGFSESLVMASLAPLGSLVFLGLATQVLMQPLLDRAATPAVLGATGAETPVAFSSSSPR